MKFTFSPLPDLYPGERCLYLKKQVWIIEGKSLPSYRLFFGLPPLWEAGVIVTDRRVLLLAYVFRLFTQQVSMWFPGAEESGDGELVTGVLTGAGAICGPYVEIISENSQAGWFRDNRLRVRLFTKDADSIRSTISSAIADLRVHPLQRN